MNIYAYMCVLNANVEKLISRNKKDREWKLEGYSFSVSCYDFFSIFFPLRYVVKRKISKKGCF